MISTSKSSPRIAAATSASLKTAFTPTAKFGENAMGIRFAAAAIAALSASENPVVPMTIILPCRTLSEIGRAHV